MRCVSRGMRSVALAMRRRNRSKSGGRSRKVTLRNVERSTGSRSIDHISASVSLRFVIAPSATLPVDLGVLELVQRREVEEVVEDAVDGLRGQLAVALGACRQPHEHGTVVHDEGG